MKIELQEITVREVVEGYVDNEEEGVIGYKGKLNIRPKYQREFIYEEKERNAVIYTIRKDFPLNVMYWVKGEGDSFEIMDGQQRTVSFCQYVNNFFSVAIDRMPKYFHTLTKMEQKQILDYKLMIYICDGTDNEKLDWFKVINIAGKPLSTQELRNAIYTGTWLIHAKSIFSKNNCAAYLHSKDYVKVDVKRQELLEVALKWISNKEIDKADDKISTYMSIHQHDPNANELWSYFRNVIGWIELTFPKYRKEMKGIDWGSLYDEFKIEIFDTEKLEQEIHELMMDDDVTNKKGIYSYVLTRKEKYLNIRTFTESQKSAAYEKQCGICKKCGEYFEFKEMHGDHITPWVEGGKTNPENCQMLCHECNRRKSDV